MVMCPTAKCPTVGSRRDVAEAALLDAMRTWLKSYQVSSKAQENARGNNDAVPSVKSVESAISRARKGLDGLKQQKSRLFDLLEQGIYTNDVFMERSRVLAGRIAEAEKQVEALREHLIAMRKAELTRKSIAPRIQNVLDVYDTLETPAEKNALLKTVLDHVVYSKTVGGRYQENNLQLFVYPKITDIGDGL